MQDQQWGSAVADKDLMSLLVEVNCIFTAFDQEEAESLLDRIMDAELEIVCPSDRARLEVCSHCHGTLENPGEEKMKEADQEETDWAPGKPCAICATSDYPGYEMPCAREHTSGATIHPDGNWLTGEDRRKQALLAKLLDTLENSGPQSAKELIKEELAVIASLEVSSDIEH